jgi:hypothetical protein
MKRRLLNSAEAEIRNLCPGYYEGGPYSPSERVAQLHIHSLIDGEEKEAIEALAIDFSTPAL